MAKNITMTSLSALTLDGERLTLLDISRAVSAPAEVIVEFVEYGGILEPIKGRSAKNWEFPSTALRRARRAIRLQQELKIDLAGLALALDLLDELEQLRQRVLFLEHHIDWK
jgi:chaperone modulatory protein CbpM